MVYYKYMPDRVVEIPHRAGIAPATTFIIRGCCGSVFTAPTTPGDTGVNVGQYSDRKITFGSGDVVQVGGRIKRTRKSKKRKSKKRKSKKRKSKTRRRR